MSDAGHRHVSTSRAAAGRRDRAPGRHRAPGQHRPTGRRAAVVAAAAVTGLLAAALPTSALPAAATPAGGGALVPVLNWHPCDAPAAHGFECATARVPLDYRAPTGPTIEIAVIRHRATSPGHRIGSLFFNSGGPGGAGTTDLPRYYSFFPAALRQRFDIIGFDPRGVGQSTAVQCFPSSAAETRFFATLPAGFPVGAAQQHRWVSRYARFAQVCQQRNAALLPHLATADVARDMDLLRQAVGDPSLNYLGVSYGSYLGATYASLFPGEVHAMVLDGIVAPTAWARPRRVGTVRLSTTLRIGSDTGQKATLRQFLDLCGQASTRRCAFSAGTPDATRAKYAALLRRLRRRPVIITIAGKGPVPVTYAGLVSNLATLLFTPLPAGSFPGWAYAAGLLQTAWRASGRGGQRHLAAGRAGAPARPIPAAPPLPAPGDAAAAAGPHYPGQEQFLAIVCADSPNPRSPASYEAGAAFGFARSGAFGTAAAWGDEPCASWLATDADGYFGPWDRWTASPILVVGNTYDPSTPYVDALTMTKELARARLLTLHGYGHTALLNPSACVNSYEAGYFLTGALPPTGTVCQQDRQPFGLAQRF